MFALAGQEIEAMSMELKWGEEDYDSKRTRKDCY
jgi:hypothetical protein